MFEGNMSKQTPEWHEKLAQAEKEHYDPNATCYKEHNCQYVLHHAYRLVNEEVQQGTRWAKCQNCGSPHIVTKDHDGTFCSTECFGLAVAAIEESW